RDGTVDSPVSGLLRLVFGDEALDFVCRLERHVLAAAQPHAELAVVDGEPAEGRLGHAGPTTERFDLEEQGFRARHSRSDFSPLCLPGVPISGPTIRLRHFKSKLFVPPAPPTRGVGRIPLAPFSSSNRRIPLESRGPASEAPGARTLGGNARMALYTWSWAFLILYIGAMLVLGWLGSRRVSGADDFATARRGYGPLLLAFAFASTAASGATFLGLPGLTYTY